MWLTRFPHGGWSPLSAGVPLLWLRADQGVTLVSGKVSSWASIVGNTSVAQATAAARPTWSVTGWASARPGVTFTGASTYNDLHASSGTLASYYTGTNVAVTIATRMNMTARTVRQQLVQWYNGSNATLEVFTDTSHHMSVDVTNGGAPIAGGLVIDGAARAFAARCGGTVSTYRDQSLDLNGAAIGNTAASSSFAIGANAFLGLSAADMVLSELIIWSSKISEADAQQCATYLKNQWP